MLITFASQFLSILCPIPSLYAKISAFLRQTPCYLRLNTCFLRQCLSFWLHCSCNVCGWVPVGCLWSISNEGVHVMRGREERVGARWWQNFRTIYCANIRPNPKSRSGSRSHRGLVKRVLQIMRSQGHTPT